VTDSMLGCVVGEGAAWEGNTRLMYRHVRVYSTNAKMDYEECRE